MWESDSNVWPIDCVSEAWNYTKNTLNLRIFIMIENVKYTGKEGQHFAQL